MKKSALLSFFVITVTLASAQWITQTAPSGTGNLYSVFAIDQNAVAASGFQRVIRTTNAGALWTSQVTVTGVNYYEVHTGITTNWYSLAQNSSWMVKLGNPSGTSLLSGRPDSILSLHFNTATCATAVGTAGKIETTCDTGNTWQVRSS